MIFRHIIGESVAIFAFIPPLVIAWQYGISRGIIAGIAADILTLVLLHVHGDNCLDFASLTLRLPGLIAIVIIAAIVGYMHELRERVKKELEEKKKTEAALVESEKRLKKKNAEILEFTNTVTHDLKKPLTVMKTICSLTKASAAASSDPEFIEATQIGAEAIGYMQEMLDDLLASAKLEAGTQELAIEEVSCKSIVDQVIQRLKYSIEEKHVIVSASEKDLHVKADPKQFGRLLMNLIGNAINYIGDKPDRHISITWEQKDGPVIFTVQDNGIGIPLETQSHLFTKFKRGANVSGISGTGLGLSIVKGIVLAHGGKIWFESKVGEGTAFHFTLEKPV